MLKDKKVLCMLLPAITMFALSSCGGGNSTNITTALQDDPSCDEIGSGNYFDGCTGYSLIDDAELISLPYVPGGTTFDFVHNGAAYPNSLYAVRVEDWSGSIDGFTPDHPIWPNLAVERAIQLFAPGSSVNGTNKVLTVDPDRDINLFALALHNGSDWFFSANGANQDGLDHMVAFHSDVEGEIGLFGFEDIYGGGDLDYDDAVYSFDPGIFLKLNVPDISSTFPIGDHFETVDSEHCITEPLANGKLDRVLTGWMSLDLHGIADRLAQERGEETKFKIQTIFDDNDFSLDVKNTESIIDEYSVRVRLRSELDVNAVFKDFLRDIDGYVGSSFEEFAVWDYPYGLPQVGDIIEIDVLKPVESAPVNVPPLTGIFEIDVLNPLGLVPDADFVPRNAPIMVIDVQEQYITVATLELNDSNHAVHGMREFGYEFENDGSVLFYARAISTVGPLSRLGGGKGEYAFWSSWVYSMSKKLEGLREVESVSGSTCQETNFFKGQDIFEKLPGSTKKAFEYWSERFAIVGTP